MLPYGSNPHFTFDLPYVGSTPCPTAPPDTKVDCLPKKTVLSKILKNGPEVKLPEIHPKAAGKVLTGSEHMKLIDDKERKKMQDEANKKEWQEARERKKWRTKQVKRSVKRKKVHEEVLIFCIIL